MSALASRQLNEHSTISNGCVTLELSSNSSASVLQLESSAISRELRLRRNLQCNCTLLLQKRSLVGCRQRLSLYRNNAIIAQQFDRISQYRDNSSLAAYSRSVITKSLMRTGPQLSAYCRGRPSAHHVIHMVVSHNHTPGGSVAHGTRADLYPTRDFQCEAPLRM